MCSLIAFCHEILLDRVEYVTLNVPNLFFSNTFFILHWKILCAWQLQIQIMSYFVSSIYYDDNLILSIFTNGTKIGVWVCLVRPESNHQTVSFLTPSVCGYDKQSKHHVFSKLV